MDHWRWLSRPPLTRRLSELADPELEQALSELATEIAFPGAPEIAIAVRGLLLAAPRPSPWWRLYPDSRRLRLAMAFAAVVLAVVLLLGLSPQARTAIADRLGLRGIDISYIPPLDATASPSETSSGRARSRAYPPATSDWGGLSPGGGACLGPLLGTHAEYAVARAAGRSVPRWTRR